MQPTFFALFRVQTRRPFAALLLLLACFPFFSQPAYAQRGAVSESEMEALRAIYEATGGAKWLHNDNWLSDEPVSTWYGVTVRGGMVIGLDLSANNLTGTLPAALQDLYGLQELYLQNNRLTGMEALPSSLENFNCLGNRLAALPELSELFELRELACANNALTALPELPATLRSLACDSNQLAALPELPERFSMLSCSHNRLAELPALPEMLEKFTASHNRLTFEDLSPVVAQLSPFSYTLAPQDSLATAAKLSLTDGDSLVLSADFADRHAGNRYQWFKNGKAIAAASVSPRYVVRSATAADAGTYTCVVTNATLTEPTGLSLHRRPVVVTVNKKTSLQPAPAPAKIVDGHGLELYPNPSKASDKVRLVNTRSERVALTLVDAQGRQVLHQAAHPARQPFAVPSNLTKGVYLLQVADGGNTQVLRLLKLD